MSAEPANFECTVSASCYTNLVMVKCNSEVMTALMRCHGM